MSAAVRRLKKQAKRFQLFNSIRTFNENTLDSDFTRRYADKLRPDVRGYGYWCWKFYLILVELRKLPEGGALLYLDAGCHLNVRGKKRFLEYMEMLRKSPIGVMGFYIGGSCIERRYTKGDIFSYFHCMDKPEITDTPQISATHIFVRKCAESIAFFEEINAVWQENFSFLDDTPSKVPNLPDFQAARHDQSLFSVLLKVKGAPQLPSGENWAKNWSNMADYPILDMRDKFPHGRQILRLWRLRLASALSYIIPPLHQKLNERYERYLTQVPYLKKWW